MNQENFPKTNVNEKNRGQVWNEVDKMTGSLGCSSALLSWERALSNKLAESELFSWGHFKWAAPSPQRARLPHAREPAPPPLLLLPSAWGWKMWGSCGRPESGSLLFIYFTTLLAWVQTHSVPFTWSANWASVPAQPWSMLRGPRHWPRLFHFKYTLDAKKGQEKHLKAAFSVFSMQNDHLVSLIKAHIVRPTPEDSDSISLGWGLGICTSKKKLYFWLPSHADAVGLQITFWVRHCLWGLLSLQSSQQWMLVGN